MMKLSSSCVWHVARGGSVYTVCGLCAESEEWLSDFNAMMVGVDALDGMLRQWPEDRACDACLLLSMEEP